MRRTLPALLTATVLLTAGLLASCGSDDDSATTSATDATASDSTVTTDGAQGATGTDAATDSSEPSAAPATNPDKPEVELPDEIPTELQITVIEPGTGPEAQAGDTVIVDYVGVRSSDGVEFDNSYDRFEPFPVVLGQGSVIKGWDDGLVGAQAGATIRLDIPSDLAYGAEPRGDIIGANEALTFLIQVRAVIQPAEPGDEPTETGVDPSEGATEVTTVVLREGEGPGLEPGQSALIRFVLFRGDNGVMFQSSWAEELQPLPYGGDIFPPLAEGLEGMKVGERRAIVFPPQYPDYGFGPEGNPTAGLPANTDAVIVVDLVGMYGTPE